MLTKAGLVPPAREDAQWAYEIKWDGVRAIAFSEPGRMRLVTRNGNDVTARYPELGAMNRALSMHRAILDGEVVAFDADGKPSFAALQGRMHLTRDAQVRRLAKEAPVNYMAFDLLWLDGRSLMDLPYERSAAARSVRCWLTASAGRSPITSSVAVNECWPPRASRGWRGRRQAAGLAL